MNPSLDKLVKTCIGSSFSGAAALKQQMNRQGWPSPFTVVGEKRKKCCRNKHPQIVIELKK